MQIHYQDVPAYTTKDGSIIRELMHPSQQGNKHQSLAEATIPAGSKTALHLHRSAEEIYHVMQGEAQMTLGIKVFTIKPGDTILIPALTAHCVDNQSNEDVIILCACSPAYQHADTELLDD